MMIEDMLTRHIPPKPWAEGEKIPWDDADFSARMLKEHLSQEHDLASRRQERIDRHVAWIHERRLDGRRARILDLGCGPGFYLQRLAALGHDCVGIDFSPASIGYARAQAAEAGLDIEYIQADLRQVAIDGRFDLVMLVFGEFNVFQRSNAEQLLEKMHQALKPGGQIILEPQTHDAIQSVGNSCPTWHSESGGLFSPHAHLWLEEHFWHADCHAATTRYFIIDAATAAVTRYASTSQAYADDEFERLLEDSSFSRIQRYPSMTGAEEDSHEGLFVLTARKATAGMSP